MAKLALGFLGLLLLLIGIGVIFDHFNPFFKQITYGVTFSPRYASYLKLDWQQVYLQILDDLKVRNLRLPGYWDILQPQPQKYNFAETDYLLNEAGKRNARVILVLGARQPRFPECHVPDWARSLSISDRKQEVLKFVAKVVERYQDHQAIWAWQVENEPFAFWFGENCDVPDEKFLQEEVKLVKQLDHKRPVIITDSGEWSNWIKTMRNADIFGTSIYRKSYNDQLSFYFPYPFLPWMYTVKSKLIKSLFAVKSQQTIVSELQAEPWLQKGVLDTAVEAQQQMFTMKDFKGNIEYAKKTGFKENYLWGVEWWYFMAENGHPEYLEYAKTLFR